MKKIKTIIKLDVQRTGQDIQQTDQTNASPTTKADKKELEGSELFSFFTANIIKEDTLFTR
jgi:hypothetical protein